MKAKLYNISIQGACILSLVGTVLCIVGMFAPGYSHCGIFGIAAMLFLQAIVLVPFAVIPRIVVFFLEAKPLPSAARRYLGYAAMVGVLCEMVSMLYLNYHPSYGASCI